MNHLLLLLPLLAISALCIAEDATQLVYDTENNKVTSKELYYIHPAEHGTGGGLGMAGNAGGQCKHFVSQVSSEADIGIPVRFVSSNESTTSGNILVSTNVTISFHIMTTCMHAMYWHVDYLSLWRPHDLVVAGKYEGESYPAPLTPDFTFRIVRHNGKTKGYKLVSCAGEGQCKDLGFSAFEKKNFPEAAEHKRLTFCGRVQEGTKYPYAGIDRRPCSCLYACMLHVFVLGVMHSKKVFCNKRQSTMIHKPMATTLDGKGLLCHVSNLRHVPKAGTQQNKVVDNPMPITRRGAGW
ncbi:hypothetical protein HU200_061117 [Digitaria exilis]|uniref:Uncharacterized protein n=1 Tax=Digitaria exilis TaxID=1010633 RepID=A0A835DWX6_9POAL|nr:hypothetical protein HU200_061117 [Digitaria exilis]